MVDFFLIILLTVILGLFSGLLYLVWLPFRNRLMRSGKLSTKIQKQIRWTFILFPCALGVLMYCFKDYRTPSKDRLESVADIKLPTDFKIIKDEYQDMWQDYCILYDIRFDNESTIELIKRIKSSKFYKSETFHKGAWKEEDFITTDSLTALWSRSPKGYDFSGQEGLTSYNIALDTLTFTLKYNECAD